MIYTHQLSHTTTNLLIAYHLDKSKTKGFYTESRARQLLLPRIDAYVKNPKFALVKNELKAIVQSLSPRAKGKKDIIASISQHHKSAQENKALVINDFTAFGMLNREIEASVYILADYTIEPITAENTDKHNFYYDERETANAFDDNLDKMIAKTTLHYRGTAIRIKKIKETCESFFDFYTDVPPLNFEYKEDGDLLQIVISK